MFGSESRLHARAIRDENMSIVVQAFADNFAARALRDARSRIAGRPAGPYQKYVSSERGLVKRGIPHHVFACARSPFSRGSFNLLVRLILGQLPVGRTRELYQHRSSVSDFGESWFGKRVCLHCFLKGHILGFRVALDF